MYSLYFICLTCNKTSELSTMYDSVQMNQPVRYVYNICISNENIINRNFPPRQFSWRHRTAGLNRAFRPVWVAKDKKCLSLQNLTFTCNTCMLIRIFYNFVFHSNVIVNKLAIYFSFCRFKLNYIYNILFLYRRKETNVVNAKHCFVISDYIFLTENFMFFLVF